MAVLSSCTVEQKLDYVKLMVNEGYSNQQIMKISGAGPTAVSRWKKQYLDELQGISPIGKKALTAACKVTVLSSFVINKIGHTLSRNKILVKFHDSWH